MTIYALSGGGGVAERVLNPTLYRQLTRLFGSVAIANEGEKFDADAVYDQATGRLRLNVKHAGEYYRIACPFCQDTRKRLWINHFYGQLGPDGRPVTHLAVCFRRNCMSTWENRVRLADQLLGMPNSRDRRLPSPLPDRGVDPGPVVFAPPGDVIPLIGLPDDHPAVQYMRWRRYTPEMLSMFDVGYVAHADPKYRAAQGRIYFPIRMHGQLVGWQTRYMGDLDWKATGVPKYYSLPHMRRRYILYNHDVAVQYPFVVVVEGPTDVHRLGGPAVALLGKSISKPQQDLLVQSWVGKPIIFLLDPEAKEEMQGLVFDTAMARRAGAVISVELPEGADPGDWETAALWRYIYQSAATQRVILPSVA